MDDSSNGRLQTSDLQSGTVNPSNRCLLPIERVVDAAQAAWIKSVDAEDLMVVEKLLREALECSRPELRLEEDGMHSLQERDEAARELAWTRLALLLLQHGSGSAEEAEAEGMLADRGCRWRFSSSVMTAPPRSAIPSEPALPRTPSKGVATPDSGVLESGVRVVDGALPLPVFQALQRAFCCDRIDNSSETAFWREHR